MAIVVSCVWPMMVAWLIARAVGQRTFFKAIERAPPPRAEIAPPVTCHCASSKRGGQH